MPSLAEMLADKKRQEAAEAAKQALKKEAKEILPSDPKNKFCPVDCDSQNDKHNCRDCARNTNSRPDLYKKMSSFKEMMEAKGWKPRENS
jgi:hypothetical protein